MRSFKHSDKNCERAGVSVILPGMDAAFHQAASRTHSRAYFGTGQIIAHIPENFILPVGSMVSHTHVSAYTAALECDFLGCQSVFADARRYLKALSEPEPFRWIKRRIQPGTDINFVMHASAIHMAITEHMAGGTRPDYLRVRDGLYQSRKRMLLSDMMDKNLIACCERSALAHHWLKSAGFDVGYVSGNIFMPEKKIHEAHSFLVSETQRHGVVIFDPAVHCAVAHAPQAVTHWEVDEGHALAAIFEMPLASWEKFLKQGKTQPSWIRASTVWEGATGGRSGYYGFDTRYDLGFAAFQQAVKQSLVNPRLSAGPGPQNGARQP